MGVEIIEQSVIPVEVDNSLRIETDVDGTRSAWRGTNHSFADDRDPEMAWAARTAIKIIEDVPAESSVAHIGGGFCCLARLLPAHRHTIFEIEPALERYAPSGSAFIPGDWHSTLTGTYDVIVYDIGDEVPRDVLTQHLNPGGLILPLETAPK